MNKYTHIRFDWAIKKLLRSKANFGILEGFLSVLLGEDIHIVDIIDSESNRETQNDKSNRVDIMVKNSKEELIIVEIQNTRELDYFYKILYNTSKAISEHISKGDCYTRVKKVITVSIVYFDLGQGEDYVYHGNTVFTGIHRSDVLELSESQKKMFNKATVTSLFPDHYIIRVNTFDDMAKDPLDEWVYFLKNSEIRAEFKAKGLEEAREKLKEINLEGAERKAYMRYLEDLMYEASIAATIKFEEQFSKEKARAEGHAEGVEEGILKVARAMKQKGISIDLIKDTTGLSIEEINSLQEIS
ncbi:MAG: Rpn family recombination-promoting nuclease/putative transposase [Candidatus Omnitrophota bacterium]